MVDPFLGEIMWFAGNFIPREFLACEGQELDIADHSALYSLLGTTFGGDGRTTFALPDLRAQMVTGQSSQLGAVTPGEAVALGADITLPGTVGLRACIAIEGTYPSRS